ncbi:MAG: M23 family metallopeptidase, partial [Rhizobiaceae bacterium]
DPTARFDEQVRELDAALDQLEAARTAVNRYPLGNPAPGAALSSTFGSRSDPILGTPAFHAGLDFRAATGDPIKATAAGTIVKAGWNGGYGQMVEIDHGKGFTTRYAHMSFVAVAPGQKVKAGAVIGKAGSTGRSTGPHLHYEVRRAGEAVDPLAFLKAGRKLAEAL